MVKIRIKVKKPKITVGKPKITVGTPKLPEITVGTPKLPEITVGGDVGKIGGKIIRGATRAIEDFGKAAVSPAKQVVEVVQGKPLDQAIKDSLQDQLRAGASAVDVVAEVDSTARAVVAKVAAKVGGETAGDIVSDVLRGLQPYPPDYASAALRALDTFLETGRIESLNPVAIIIAGEITNARNLLWDAGRPIPAEVIAAMPEELRARAGVCRHLKLSEVSGNTTLPKIAIQHLNNASAVCLVDLIVFKSIPGHSGDQDLHYWAHELHHAQQYAAWGIQEFATRYVKNELGTGLNPIEEDADLYACNFFPNAAPGYIKVCPT